MRKTTIFVSTPSGSTFNDLYFNSIKPICDQGNLETVCFLEHPQIGIFERRISANILYSNLVIGILTKLSPNVLYELGIAIGCGKPIILLSDNTKSIPSMVKQYDIINYKNENPTNILEQLQKRIEAVLFGGYITLRIKTHSELLYRTGRVTYKNNIAKIAEEKLLENAIVEYNNGAYQNVIDLLTSVRLVQLNGAEQAFFFLSDAYFLYSETVPEGGLKHAILQKMLETSLEGHKLFPTNRDITKNLGLARLKLRQFKLATKVFNTLLINFPNYDVARYNLACIYAQTGELISCIRELKIIIDKDHSWKKLARVDPDFNPLWHDQLFQRLLFPMLLPL